MSAAVTLIAVSDLHLRLKPPIAREAEDNWLEAQLRPLRQLDRLQRKYEVPIVVAGDLFDRYVGHPELINWVLENLVLVYAVPGNHDLPEHRFDDIKRSSFYTLVKAGTVKLLEPDMPIEVDVNGRFLRLWGFPCGFELKPNPSPFDMCQEIAVVHAYIWTGKADTGFYGAPEDKNLKSYKSKIVGYDAVILGDNHIGFACQVGETAIINCGGFQQLTHPDENHLPSAWLLYSDNSVSRVRLDVSEDKFSKPTEFDRIVKESKGKALVEELRMLGNVSGNFKQRVEQEMTRRNVNSEVRAIVSRGLESVL